MHSVQISNQGGKRGPDIVRETGHELPVGFISPPEQGEFVFVGYYNLVDFKCERCGEFMLSG